MTDSVDVGLPCLSESAAPPSVLSRIPAGHRPIVADARRGFGAVANGGLEAATASVVCFLDADGSFDPAQLPRVVDPVAQHRADLVLGRRRPMTVRAWPVHARRADLLGLKVADRRFGYPLEMVVKAARAGRRVGEVDADYAPRTEGGQSRVTGTVRGTVRAVLHMSRVVSG